MDPVIPAPAHPVETTIMLPAVLFELNDWAIDVPGVVPLPLLCTSTMPGLNVNCPGKARMSVLEPLTAVLTVNAKAWLDVAEGRESDSVSELELTCSPAVDGLNAASWITQPVLTGIVNVAL